MATYTKRDKSDSGWLRQGWFSHWFKRLYRNVAKSLSTYTKVSK